MTRETGAERALEDIDQIYRYIEKRNPTAARTVLRAIFAGIQFIAAHLEVSALSDEPRVRVSVVQRYQITLVSGAGSF